MKLILSLLTIICPMFLFGQGLKLTLKNSSKEIWIYNSESFIDHDVAKLKKKNFKDIKDIILLDTECGLLKKLKIKYTNNGNMKEGWIHTEDIQIDEGWIKYADSIDRNKIDKIDCKKSLTDLARTFCSEDYTKEIICKCESLEYVDLQKTVSIGTLYSFLIKNKCADKTLFDKATQQLLELLNHTKPINGVEAFMDSLISTFQNKEAYRRLYQGEDPEKGSFKFESWCIDSDNKCILYSWINSQLTEIEIISKEPKNTIMKYYLIEKYNNHWITNLRIYSGNNAGLYSKFKGEWYLIPKE